MYGLYKQATVGDNTTTKPGMLAGLVARGKWDAWTTQKGASKDEAAAKYIELIKELCGAIEEPPKEKKPR